MNPIESVQAAPKAHASFFQVMKAVLWSMLGVCQHKGYEDDTAKITLWQAVIAGLIGGFIFVLSMLTFVYFIIGQMSK